MTIAQFSLQEGVIFVIHWQAMLVVSLFLPELILLFQTCIILLGIWITVLRSYPGYLLAMPS